MSPTLAGGFITTGPPEKSSLKLKCLFFSLFKKNVKTWQSTHKNHKMKRQLGMVIKSVDAGAQLPGFKPCRSCDLGQFPC